MSADDRGRPVRIAVVDLGTNSTRLLVADVEDGAVRELERRTDVTRLGEEVDASGSLSQDAMARVFDTLAGYRRLIDQREAGRVVAVATSAVRDAINGEEFRQALRERFEIDARTIPGEEEARLTFLGATAARAASGHPMLVIDVGGGSTELVIGCGGEPPSFHVSTQLGSVRQTERHLHSDPATEEELEELSAKARTTLEESVPAELRTSVKEAIAVAGTPTSLAAIEQRLDPYDPARVEGYMLTREGCAEALAMLAALPIEDRRAVTGLHPGRAPTIVAGVAILVEAIRAFGLAAVEVSEADILHGAALDAVADHPPGACA